MVDFRENIPQDRDPNWLGQAKEIRDVQDLASNIKIRQESTAFDSIARAISGGINAIDTTVKKHMENEVYDTFDPMVKERNDALKTEAEGGTTETPPSTPENKPPSPENTELGFRNLKAQFDQGKISETDYYAKLDAAARTLRSRYPGYRDELDRMITRATGVNTANALMNARENLLKSSQEARSKAADRFATWEQSPTTMENLPPNYWQRKAENNPYSEMETRAYVASRLQEKANLESAKSQLAYDASKGELVEKRAEQVARGTADSVVTRTMALANPILKNIADKIQRGETPTDQDRETINTQIIQLKAMAQTAMNEEFNKKIEGSDKTLGMFLGSKKDSILKDAMSYIDVLEQAANSKDKGWAEALSRHNESKLNAQTKELLDNHPMISTLAAIGKAGGPAAQQAITNVLSVPGSAYQKALNADVKSAIDSMAVSTATGGAHTPGGKTSLNEQTGQLYKAFGKNPANFRAHLESQAGIIAAGNVDAKTKETAAMSIYGADDNQKFLGYFQSSQASLDMFSVLASNKVTEGMKALKGTPAWDAYKKWANNTFIQLYTQAAKTLGTTYDASYYDIKFDEKSGTYTAVPNDKGRELYFNKVGKARDKMGMQDIMDGLGRLTGVDIRDPLDKINKGMRLLSPILKESEHVPAEEITKLNAWVAQHGSPETKNLSQKLFDYSLKEDYGEAKKLVGQTTESFEFGGTHPNFTQASGENKAIPGGITLSPENFGNEQVQKVVGQYYDRGMNVLINEGKMPKHIAQGFMGNFKVESGFAEDVLSGRRRGDGGKAIGAAQWHPDRQAHFRQVFGKRLEDATFEEQMKFVVWEWNHTEAGAREQIMKAKTPAEAAALIDKYYERSTGEHRGRRMAEAERFAAMDKRSSSEPSGALAYAEAEADADRRRREFAERSKTGKLF